MKRIMSMLVLAMLISSVTLVSADEPIVGAHHKVFAPATLTAPTKMCVSECQPTKKTVYSSVSKDYCLARRPLLDWLHGCCESLMGGEGCDHCSDVHTKNVLVKKIVTGKPVEKCVVKAVPLFTEPIPQK